LNAAAPFNPAQMSQPAPHGGAAPRPPMLLHLPPGVSLAGVRSAEAIMDERVEEILGDTAAAPELHKHETLPDLYYAGMESWPVSCSLRCWGCTFTFTGRPFFIPASMEMRRVRTSPTTPPVSVVVFERLGVTCSPNCSASYIAHAMHGTRGAQARENLLHLHYAMTGRRFINIREAPFYTELESFGGSLSDAQFWKTLEKLAPENSSLAYRLDFDFSEEPRGCSGWNACADGAASCEDGAASCEDGAAGAASCEDGAADELDLLDTVLGLGGPADTETPAEQGGQGGEHGTDDELLDDLLAMF